MDLEELAARTGVNAADLRVYERKGLITARQVSGRRSYDEDEIPRIRTIRSLFAFEMSAESIRRILAVPPCEPVTTTERNPPEPDALASP